MDFFNRFFEGASFLNEGGKREGRGLMFCLGERGGGYNDKAIYGVGAGAPPCSSNKGKPCLQPYVGTC